MMRALDAILTLFAISWPALLSLGALLFQGRVRH